MMFGRYKQFGGLGKGPSYLALLDKTTLEAPELRVFSEDFPRAACVNEEFKLETPELHEFS